MITRSLRPLGALLILGVGIVHLEQYFDFYIKDVPTIGVLFLLTAFGAGAICIMLASSFWLVPAASGILLSLVALISILIARYASGGLFNYREVSWRAPIVVAVALEVAAVLTLSAMALSARRQH